MQIGNWPMHAQPSRRTDLVNEPNFIIFCKKRYFKDWLGRKTIKDWCYSLNARQKDARLKLNLMFIVQLKTDKVSKLPSTSRSLVMAFTSRIALE